MVTEIYANAVAKYNEGKLLDGEKIRRLMDAEFSDAVKMLVDYGYGNGTVDEKSYDIDAFISGETASLIDYVLSASPDENLTKILTSKFLYGNAKAYYKARLGGKFNRAALYSMPDGEVRESIEKGDYSALDEPMGNALTALDEYFSEHEPDPKTIDVYLTRAMYESNLRCARKSRNKSLVAFVRGEIDLVNIMSALRAAALKLRESAFSPLVIEGGKMDAEDILAIFSSQEPAKKILETEYDFLLAGSDEPNLPLMEARTDEYLRLIWEKDCENMQSLSPFVRYFFSQLGEYKTVKMILTCLRNGAREEIRSRLRTEVNA